MTQLLTDMRLTKVACALSGTLLSNGWTRVAATEEVDAEHHFQSFGVMLQRAPLESAASETHAQ